MACGCGATLLLIYSLAEGKLSLIAGSSLASSPGHTPTRGGVWPGDEAGPSCDYSAALS